jgi:ectoine hydroxylase-related dioxygenase (phytanoyl-CoA dioxygenase family)
MQNMQQCYQRAGSLLIFSRELPHNIFPNESEHFRYAQYLRMAPESTLMLTAEDKAVRKREVKKMLPAYLDVNNDLCREIFMLDEDETSQ